MATPKEVRLTSVPESVYMVLLEYKAKEEKRLKRVCTFTDAVRAIINEKHVFAISNNLPELLKDLK